MLHWSITNLDFRYEYHYFHNSGALSTFSHAHKYLLEEDCIVVPDSAVIYAQVVECYTLQDWNKLNDLADEEMEVILKTPQKVLHNPHFPTP